MPAGTACSPDREYFWEYSGQESTRRAAMCAKALRLRPRFRREYSRLAHPLPRPAPAIAAPAPAAEVSVQHAREQVAGARPRDEHARLSARRGRGCVRVCLSQLHACSLETPLRSSERAQGTPDGFERADHCLDGRIGLQRYSLALLRLVAPRADPAGLVVVLLGALRRARDAATRPHAPPRRARS
jgi:hypothetical protein